MSKPLAHSARGAVPEQTYRDHVSEVVRLARQFGLEATAFSPGWRESFLVALDMATSYHDLGKLDEIFQEDLNCNRRKTRLNHVDAGVAHLLETGCLEAAVAVYSHHLGLPSFPSENAKRANGLDLRLRDQDSEVAGSPLWRRTNNRLEQYLAIHHGLFSPLARPAKAFGREKGGLPRRLLLSCLVDADHFDTARHYGNEQYVQPLKLRAGQRLIALDRYISSLATSTRPVSDSEHLRRELRQDVYRACRERAVEPGETILACDSPVGTGKTTAVMAHLLRVAAERGLHRVFVVLPFTNIIDQSVDVYRRVLRLPSETEDDMQAVVAAHHHRVGYDREELRHLAARWDSPVVVTTAVEFFETLAANDTGALRKFHQVPGSAIFVDEAHASLSAALWPQMFRWLHELCRNWGCHLVLASGSLARFWALDDFVPPSERPEIPELVSKQVGDRTKSFESQRVCIRTHPERISLMELIDLVLAKPGPRLVIVNTVQSAAVLADALRREKELGTSVEHLSTALTPLDRTETIRRVRARLLSGEDDWCLVATSCVEAGVDFSFRSAFRESWGVVNLLQIAGRVSRSGEYRNAEVWDFRHDDSRGLSAHPQAKLARQILAGLLKKCAAEQRQLSGEDCTEALRLELRNDRGVKALRIEEIDHAEKWAEYPEVARLCKVIQADTRTVLVDAELVRRVEDGDPARSPSWRDIMQRSVQIWANRLDAGRWPVKPIGRDGEVWAWIGRYDKFLGYMAGVLDLMKAGRTGFDPL
jgi:CRISPR-associated endonuclease Cas3-HD